MNASRILPTVAFSVAVSFFFVPPVVALMKNAPATVKPVSGASLIVANVPVAATPVRAKMQSEGVCSPSEASTPSSTSGAKRSPWNPWVVASLESR